MASRVPLINLPELRYPTNALLDFSSIQNALMERRKAEEFNARHALDIDRVGMDQERLGIERDRLGLESRRTDAEIAARKTQLGYEGDRVGMDRDRLGLQQMQDQRANEERQAVRLGNMASTINSIQDDNARRSAWERFVMSTPRLPQLLTAYGQDPADHRNGPAFIMSQVPDQAERYRPNLVTGAPGSVISEIAPGPGGATARPVVNVPSRPRELSPSDLRGLRDEGNQLSAINRLSTQFNDQYTMPGWGALINAGDARNWAGRHMSNSSQNAQAAAQWWQDYQRSLELVQRHALFGSALTPGEQAAWRAAAVTPNMTPDAIRTNLGRQREILQTGMTNYARALVSQGYDPTAISESYGIPPQAMGLPAARTVRTAPVGPQEGPPAAAPQPGQPTPQQGQPPVPGARLASDKNWYVEDPQNPGRFFRVDP